MKMVSVTDFRTYNLDLTTVNQRRQTEPNYRLSGKLGQKGNGADKSGEAKQRQSNRDRLSLSSKVQPQAVGLSLPT